MCAHVIVIWLDDHTDRWTGLTLYGLYGPYNYFKIFWLNNQRIQILCHICILFT